MTTARETALAALDVLIATALAPLAADVTIMPRNTELAQRIAALESDNSKSVVVLTDGEAAEPDVVLGDTPVYDHVQTAVLEVISIHADAEKRTAGMDAIFAALSDAFLADSTLGGACDYAGPHPPSFSNLGDDGVPDGKAAELPIDLLFSSSSRLG